MTASIHPLTKVVSLAEDRYWLGPCGHWADPRYLLCPFCRYGGRPSTDERARAIVAAEAR